eukprot:gene17750-biopygen6709
MPGYSIYQGGTVVAFANVTDVTACCALCHGDYKDECVGWEWVNVSEVHRSDHSCDIFAKAGKPAKARGRVSGVASPSPTPPPVPPPPQRQGW